MLLRPLTTSQQSKTIERYAEHLDDLVTRYPSATELALQTCSEVVFPRAASQSFNAVCQVPESFPEASSRLPCSANW